jgi:ppGpp synthetase/RelA/SpoT-type nucleotidyltranferase
MTILNQVNQDNLDLTQKWKDFHKKLSQRERNALALFLQTKPGALNEQLRKINDQIDCTVASSKEAFEVVCKSISSIDSSRIRASERKDNMPVRFTYADPHLKGRERFFAEVSPIRPKNPIRCAEKLVKGRTWAEFGGSAKAWLGDQHWWERIYDLAAFRVVCNFLNDVERVRYALMGAFSQSPFAEPMLRDFIWDVDLARKRGARSIHLLLYLPSPKGCRAELQLMTTLQQAWDYKEHVLEYEIMRENGEPKDSRKILLRSLSDLLFVADETFNRIYLGER